LFDTRETLQVDLSDFDHAAADLLNVWLASQRPARQRGEVATAADYNEQAQRIFDELKLRRTHHCIRASSLNDRRAFLTASVPLSSRPIRRE
jgi:hypothetical protein